MADDQSVHPAPPNRLAPMNGDARDQFARIAAAAPSSPMIESAFLRSKVHMLGTNPLMSLEERRAGHRPLGENERFGATGRVVPLCRTRRGLRRRNREGVPKAPGSAKSGLQPMRRRPS